MAVIRQTMASDPDDRILDAFALADRLRELGTDLGPSGAAPGPAARSSPQWDDPRPAGEPGSRRSRRAPAVSLLVAVLGIAAGLGIQHAFLGGQAPSGSRSSGSATAPARSPTAAPPPDAGAIDAARPTALTAVDDGTSVVLRWHLAASNRYPLFVQESSPDQGPSAPTPVPNGSTVAWSTPTCIRGAIARPTPTP